MSFLKEIGTIIIKTAARYMTAKYRIRKIETFNAFGSNLGWKYKVERKYWLGWIKYSGNHNTEEEAEKIIENLTYEKRFNEFGTKL